MNRLLSLVLALILAIAPAGLWANDVVHMQRASQSFVEAAAHDHTAGETGDRHAGYQLVGGCSAMPGHCIAEVIVPVAGHFVAVRIAFIHFSIHAHDPRIGIPVSADPPPPRA